MKNVLKIEEMMSYLPSVMKDAISNTSKNCGIKVDSLELHRHSHSEKSKTNQLEPGKRQSLSYVSVRTQDRDDEIVIPEALDLKSFLAYRHVLVNHNYSLLPIGSDEHIEADDWGLKALTNHAETGEGTLANVIWSLVSQGHMNAKSIGFVPTGFTKPGDRNWDACANQLERTWKEFSKSRAEKSVSRIITGGVLLEHSFVSVPANSDSVVIGVIKGMNLDSKVAKQLGWEMKDGILVTKAAVADPVPSVCDECGYVADAVVGSKCPECKTGAMKAKGKEKAIEIITPAAKREPVQKENPHMPGGSFTECVLIMGKKGHDEESAKKICGAMQAESGEKIYDVIAEVVNKQKLSVEKATSLPCTCDECDTEADCAPGSTCQEPDCDGTMVADKREKGDVQGHEFHGNQYTGGGGGAKDDEKYNTGAQKARDRSYSVGARVATPKGEYGKVVGFDKDGSFAVVRSEDTGKVSSYHNADLQMVDEEGDSDEEDKSFSPEIKVVRPAPSVKVLFVPPSSSEIAQRVGDAVEKALSRRTGKIM